MTAYFMQEPILEPYAGLIFNFSVGESTQLTGYHQSGILLGMIIVGLLVTGVKFGSLRFWVLFGCVGSGSALILIALLGQISPSKDVLKLSLIHISEPTRHLFISYGRYTYRNWLCRNG